MTSKATTNEARANFRLFAFFTSTLSMTELYNFQKLSCPFKRGSKYYFFSNSGLQNQDVLYSKETLDGELTIFFDVNTLSEDGTTALANPLVRSLRRKLTSTRSWRSP